MFEASENEVITPAQRELLEVFSTELSEVKFPDMDAGVLKEAVERVKEKAEAVAKAQAALEEAKQALGESQEALQQKGQRALAYARVFAEGDAALSTKLEALHLTRPVRKEAAQGEESAPKRRGRPPKSRPSAPLFSDGAAPEPAAAAHEAPEAPVLAEAPRPERPPVARPAAA